MLTVLHSMYNEWIASHVFYIWMKNGTREISFYTFLLHIMCGDDSRDIFSRLYSFNSFTFYLNSFSMSQLGFVGLLLTIGKLGSSSYFIFVAFGLTSYALPYICPLFLSSLSHSSRSLFNLSLSIYLFLLFFSFFLF